MVKIVLRNKEFMEQMLNQYKLVSENLTNCELIYTKLFGDFNQIFTSTEDNSFVQTILEV